jgi:HTH-type transcriptional regulator / antitoxin HigA
MNIKPIRSKADYHSALQRVEAIWDAPKGSAEDDELDILVALIEAYERERYPIGPPDPIAAIKFRLEQTGKDTSALIGIIGQRPRVYEVMNGLRPLSINMIRSLHFKLGIPLESLIQPSRRRAKRKPVRPRSRTRRGRRALRKSS